MACVGGRDLWVLMSSLHGEESERERESAETAVLCVKLWPVVPSERPSYTHAFRYLHPAQQKKKERQSQL